MTNARSFLRAAGLVALLLATPASAAFEDIEVSPRLRGVGGAAAALETGPAAAFHNPASLAWTVGIAAEVSTVQPFGYDFSRQSAAGLSLALPRRMGGAALGVRTFEVSWQGERLTRETTVALAQGFRLLADRQSELAVGWGLQLYALDYGTSITGLDPGQATALGVNVGAAASLRERTRVGFWAENLANAGIGDRDSEELGRRVRGGVAYEPYAGVRTALDLASELGEAVQYRGGVEVAVSDVVTLRAGARTEPNTLSAGFGLAWRGMRVDYGYSTGGGVLGESHHVGLGLARAAGGRP